MSPAHEQERIASGLKLVARLATESMRALPIQQQILTCEGLHAALDGRLTNEARHARETAEALRRADSLQRNFLDLLKAD